MALNRRIFLTQAVAAGGAVSMLGASASIWDKAQAADNAELLKPGPLGDNILGDAKAPVTIIEYASMTCPHCAAFHAQTYPALKKKYIDTGKARFIFREFPLDNLSLAAFMLARCVDKSKYFAFVDVLFEKQREWSRTNDPRSALFKLAKFVGMTEAEFNGCLKNVELAKGVREVGDRASQKFAVSSTPTFFINGEMVSGNVSLEVFEKRINSLVN